MKLQKLKAYKRGRDKWSYKYVITLPETSIREAGWREGEELKATVKDSAINLQVDGSPPKPRRIITTKMPYPEFRDKIKQTLQFSDGMTWRQIREKHKFDQIVPNNKWVRQMEKDIGLIRVRRSDGVIVWRVSHVR